LRELGHHGRGGEGVAPGRRAFMWYAPSWTRFSSLSPLTRVAIGIFFNLASYLVPFSLGIVLLASVLVLMHLSGVKWKTMWFVWVGNAMLLASFLLSWGVLGSYEQNMHVIFELWAIRITLENLLFGLMFWVRMMSALFGTLFILTVCTDADLLVSLRLIHIPHFLSMIVAFTFRGLQLFFDDMFAIIEAQNSRGLDLNKLSLLQKLKWFVALIVPLFVLEFRKMEETANAADSRGYSLFGGKKRTELRLQEAKLRGLDYLVVGFLIVLLVYMILNSFFPLGFNLLQF
jgi:energy-coupling factor transport system permease protein